MSNVNNISVDAEVDGLYGKSLAIGVVVRVAGQTIDQFVGRVDDLTCTDSWVQINVVPKIKDIDNIYESSDALEEAFYEFWLKYKNVGVTIAHCSHPVETGLFKRCVERDLDKRMWDAPFPLHEVATVLMCNGYNPLSVDEYMTKHKLKCEYDSDLHNPLYDAMVAAQVFEHLMKK